MAAECPRCNTVTYSSRTTCGTCGNGLSSTRSNPSSYPLRQEDMMSLKHQKMAVFDIDETLFDTTQRTRNAIRAGVLAKDGSRPKGDRAFHKFLDKNRALTPDKPIPGTVEFVNSLARKNYMIAYLTARPKRIRKKTIESLEDAGYPVFDDHDSTPMVYLKMDGDDTPKFKQDKLRELQRRFNVLYFYDDLVTNREMAQALDIPGVYDLRERLGVVASNPPTGGSKGPDGEPLPDGLKWLPGLGIVRDPPQGKGWHKVIVPVASYQDSNDAKQAVAVMADLPLSEIHDRQPPGMDSFEGPWESATRLNISGTNLPTYQFHFFYESNKQPWTNPRKNPLFGKKKPKYEYGSVPKGKFVMHRGKSLPMPSKTGITIYGADWCRPCMAAKDFCKEKGLKGRFVKIADKEGKPTKYTKEFMTMIPPLTNNYEYIPVIFINGHFVKEGGQGLLMWYILSHKPQTKSNPSYATCRVCDNKQKITGVVSPETRTIPLNYLDFTCNVCGSKKWGAAELVKDNPRRKNPSLESKGRELYAKFNGKKPASVKKETIDIPPVWVKIGEGGAWSIGYNSGKETGDSNQRYIHNFNEDTKDGNFPDLYAAINEDGSAELLVIRGGTFKLETRDDGLSWLVD